MRRPVIAILLHDTLQAVAIKQIARHINADAVIARDDDELLSRLADQADHIITDAIHFVAHLRWFMPRRAHTIIADVNPLANDGDAAGADDGPRWLSLPCSQRDLVRQLSAMVSSDTDMSRDGDTVPPSVLSPRETQVLRLVASGLINKEIADRLNISVNTVLTHRKNITSKLGIKRISGLSVYAIMNSLI